MLNCKLLKGKRPIFAFKVIVITAMNRIIENLKVNNPAIYQILQEQEKQKWEITSGTRYKTVSDTVSANTFLNYLNIQTEILFCTQLLLPKKVELPNYFR